MEHHAKHRSVSPTARYFGISRQTFYTWYRRYDPNDLWSLESRSSWVKTGPAVVRLEDAMINPPSVKCAVVGTLTPAMAKRCADYGQRLETTDFPRSANA
jgi:hypothetical protein